MPQLSPQAQRSISERLDWTKKAVQGLILALGPDVLDMGIKVESTADPLTWIVTLPLKRAVMKGSRAPLRDYFRCWAKIGDCHVPRIAITKRFVRAEILIKTRHKLRRFHEKRFGTEEIKMKSFWVSWYGENGVFELHSPWWISGERGDDGAKTFCAAVKAENEEEAKKVILDSHDDKDIELEWRFVEEQKSGWSPYNDRFPEAGWMVWA